MLQLLVHAVTCSVFLSLVHPHALYAVFVCSREAGGRVYPILSLISSSTASRLLREALKRNRSVIKASIPVKNIVGLFTSASLLLSAVILI